MGFREEVVRDTGGWQIHSQVGAGGFGKVFLAYKGERRGALKVLRPDYVKHENPDAFRQSFESEAEILSKLRGPYTAELIESDLSGYTPWIATRFVPGDTLAYQVKYENPVRGRAWWDLAHGLFSGLAEAHGKGIIHRDIKPSNVMRSADVPAIVIDFGIALLASGNDTWKRAGTRLFQSPEQRNGDELTTASDVYSAALTLLYVTTKPDSRQREEFTKSEPPGVPFVDDVFDSQSSEAEFLRQALSLDPTQRPSADQLVELCSFHSRFGDVGAPRKIPLALPPNMSAPETIMSRGVPDMFSMEPPTRTVRPISWAQVESAVASLLRIKPGRAARVTWPDDGVKINVFGAHTDHVVVELSHPFSSRDSVVRDLKATGWAPPDSAADSGWIFVVPGGRQATTEASKAVVEVLRDVLKIAPSKPERF